MSFLSVRVGYVTSDAKTTENWSVSHPGSLSCARRSIYLRSVFGKLRRFAVITKTVVSLQTSNRKEEMTERSRKRDRWSSRRSRVCCIFKIGRVSRRPSPFIFYLKKNILPKNKKKSLQSVIGLPYWSIYGSKSSSVSCVFKWFPTVEYKSNP